MSSEQGVGPDPAPAAVHCFWCGAAPEPPAAGVPLTWSLLTTDQRDPQLLCASCTRTHLRSIESQLPPEWW